MLPPFASLAPLGVGTPRPQSPLATPLRPLAFARLRPSPAVRVPAVSAALLLLSSLPPVQPVPLPSLPPGCCAGYYRRSSGSQRLRCGQHLCLLLRRVDR